MKKHIFNEENIVLLSFIALGVFWIIKAREFPANPGGLNPSFFPTATAVMMILFCAGAIAKNLIRKEDDENNTELDRFILIGEVLGLLAVLIVLCKYVSPYVGVPVFIFAYMMLIAKMKLVNNLILTAATTGLILVAMNLLHINM